MNSPKPATQKSTTMTILPDWVEQEGKSNYDIVKAITGQPLQQYQGPQVANQSNMTTQGYDWLMKNVGASDPLYQQAAGMLSEGYNNSGAMFGQGADTLARAAAMDPSKAADPYFQNAATMLGKAGEDIDIQKWLNPWTAEVEQNAMRNLSESLAGSQMAQADKAASSGAFGGSRQGIEAAVLGAEGAKKAGDLSAELRAAGWDTATANAFADAKRQLDVGLGWGTTGTQVGNIANTQMGNLGDIGTSQFAGGTAIGNQAQGIAGGLTDVGKTRAATTLAEVTGMLAGGGMEQQYNQAQIDADMAKFAEAQGYPLSMANARMAALGLTPYEQGEKTKTTGTSESKGTDWLTALTGGAKFLAELSDRTEKTDIKKVGKEGGLDMYAFRYKGDPKSYPKVVGPMAQDVKKKDPSAVGKVGGVLTLKPKSRPYLPGRTRMPFEIP
jgi:hypothetical protein